MQMLTGPFELVAKLQNTKSSIFLHPLRNPYKLFNFGEAVHYEHAIPTAGLLESSAMLFFLDGVTDCCLNCHCGDDSLAE